ncbi:hypothetical protein QFZ34_003910 [Phyllobacterium ifriqiyense]|uniref:Uncharacterized protein n=1 Tax=Phyllobacterium ifriqiyense TaxID=314238 RepID=A0ABU0SD90_9HYPH|nr:hypothetical protein [Phyllobacterium ifriqiyense]MDQ0998728.1 hypothetical protein [Phyllobacterium ifriqiyense]
MPGLLHPLHEGHAPIILHNAFQDAIDALEDWELGRDEPVIDVNERQVAISTVFRRLGTCTDILPARTLAVVEDLLPLRSAEFKAGTSTYADAAYSLWELCLQKRAASNEIRQ